MSIFPAPRLPRLGRLASAPAAIALTALASVAEAQGYSAAPLPAGTTTKFEVVVYGGSLSGAGHVAGYGVVAGGYWRGLVTGPNAGGPPAELGPFPGEPAGAPLRALGVSDDGRAVGYASIAGQIRPVYWDGTSLRDLGTFGGYNGVAYDVNSAGHAVGWAETPTSYHRAFVSGANGGALTDLGTLGGTNADAVAINEAGRIVGIASTNVGSSHAAYWDPTAGGYGAATMIGGLGGSSSSQAFAVSEAGSASGWAWFGASGARPFYWSGLPGQDALMIDVFDDLIGGIEAAGAGVNSAGRVVGYQQGNTAAGVVRRAFLWDEAGGLRDLDAVVTGWTFTDARGINDAGQILALGREGGAGAEQWVLLMPQSAVPEPGTWTLLMTGLGALGAVARRRRSA